MVNYGVLVCGQSNAAGSAGPSALMYAADGVTVIPAKNYDGQLDPAPDFDGAEKPDPRIHMWVASSGMTKAQLSTNAAYPDISQSLTFVTAANPITAPQPLKDSCSFCFHFAKQLLLRLNAADHIYLINYAVPASSIQDKPLSTWTSTWSPTADAAIPQWQKLAINATLGANYAAQQVSGGFQWLCMLWHQGEQDPTLANYGTSVKAVFTYIRTQLNMSALPIVAGTLGKANVGTATGLYIQNQLQADNSPNLRVASLQDMATSSSTTYMLADNVHFNRAGHRVMGQRYLDKLLEMWTAPNAPTAPPATAGKRLHMVLVAGQSNAMAANGDGDGKEPGEGPKNTITGKKHPTPALYGEYPEEPDTRIKMLYHGVGTQNTTVIWNYGGVANIPGGGQNPALYNSLTTMTSDTARMPMMTARCPLQMPYAVYSNAVNGAFHFAKQLVNDPAFPAGDEVLLVGCAWGSTGFGQPIAVAVDNAVKPAAAAAAIQGIWKTDYVTWDPQVKNLANVTLEIADHCIQVHKAVPLCMLWTQGEHDTYAPANYKVELFKWFTALRVKMPNLPIVAARTLFRSNPVDQVHQQIGEIGNAAFITPPLEVIYDAAFQPPAMPGLQAGVHYTSNAHRAMGPMFLTALKTLKSTLFNQGTAVPGPGPIVTTSPPAAPQGIYATLNAADGSVTVAFWYTTAYTGPAIQKFIVRSSVAQSGTREGYTPVTFAASQLPAGSHTFTAQAVATDGTLGAVGPVSNAIVVGSGAPAPGGGAAGLPSQPTNNSTLDTVLQAGSRFKLRFQDREFVSGTDGAVSLLDGTVFQVVAFTTRYLTMTPGIEVGTAPDGSVSIAAGTTKALGAFQDFKFNEPLQLADGVKYYFELDSGRQKLVGRASSTLAASWKLVPQSTVGTSSTSPPTPATPSSSTTTVPEAPECIAVLAPQVPNSIDVYFGVPKNGGLPLLKFRVQQLGVDASRRDVSDQPVRFSSLLPGTSYQFQVWAVNANGDGARCTTPPVTIPPAAASSPGPSPTPVPGPTAPTGGGLPPAQPPSAPSQLQAFSASGGADVDLMFQSPTQLNGAPLLYYHVETQAAAYYEFKFDTSTQQPPLRIRGLPSLPAYSFRVRGENRAGLGLWSEWSAVIAVTSGIDPPKSLPPPINPDAAPAAATKQWWQRLEIVGPIGGGLVLLAAIWLFRRRSKSRLQNRDALIRNSE